MRFKRKISFIVFWILFIPLIFIQLPIIVFSSIIIALGFEKAKYINDKFKLFNKWLENVLLGIEENKTDIIEPTFQITTLIDPRPEELKSLPHEINITKNVFDEESYVFYFEPKFDPLINEYLSAKYHEINNYLDRKGIKFIYANYLKTTSQQEFNELLDYYFPDTKVDAQARIELESNLHSVSFFAELLGVEYLERPCFIRNIYDYEKKEMAYRLFYLPNNDKEILDQSVSFYLSVIRHAYFSERLSRAQYSRGGRDLDDLEKVTDREKELPNPDKTFEKEISKLSDILRDEINEELRKNKSKGAMRMALFLLKQMKDYNVPANPQVKHFIEALHTGINTQKLSPITITSTGKLILTDYNKEIKLEPVHRAVYIFFLLKQDGIMFKDLPSYKNELLHIYGKLSNRSSLKVLDKTIDDLVNPFSNSMSEKCSRIRMAFLKEMDERIARYYFIDGDRKQNKRILLDRNLVIFEDNIF